MHLNHWLFFKRENKRLEEMEDLINKINIKLAQNEAIDSQRWHQIEKGLEDRRQDVIKLYDLVQSRK